MDLHKTYAELEERYPPGFPYDRNNVRLGIAALEDETAEVWTIWEKNKHRLGLGDIHENIREELLQVAAVAMMVVQGIDEAYRDREEHSDGEDVAG